MENSKKIRLAAAVAVGYVLGRTKKGKLALGLAPLVAGQQLPMNPRELAILAARKLAENPAVGPLVERARVDVLDAGRSALSATTDRRLEAVADALQQRTEALLEAPIEDNEDNEENEEEEEEEEFEERDETGAEEPEEEEEEERPRRRSAKRSAAKKAPTKKASTRKAPEKKAPARKRTAAKKSTAKKSTPRDSRRR